MSSDGRGGRGCAGQHWREASCGVSMKILKLAVKILCEYEDFEDFELCCMKILNCAVLRYDRPGVSMKILKRQGALRHKMQAAPSELDPLPDPQIEEDISSASSVASGKCRFPPVEISTDDN